MSDVSELEKIAEPVKQKKSYKRVFILIIIVIVLLASVTAGLLLVRSRQSNKKPAAVVNPDSYDAKKALLVAKLATTPDAQKLDVSKEITQLANDNGDRATAIEYAKKSVAIKSDAQTNATLAITAELAGDKSLAISSYEKAAELSKPNGTDEYSDYAYYSGKKQELEAQK